MSVLRSQLQLTVQDRATGPLRAISAQLAAFRAQTSRSMMAPVSGTIGRLAAFGGAYLGVTAGMSGTVGAARNMQAALTEIGIKGDLTDGKLNQLRQSMTQLAPRVNQTTRELLAGVDTMVTMGLSAEQAAAAMPAIGKTATATMSSIDDLSAASVSAMQNFKVAPSEVAKMLDAMAEAGNQGAFEMRDMARHFPALTASAQALGMDGVDGITDMAAALQIARRGAGDASTAANNLSNFLGKIMSPEVAKRFKKFGVDTTKELEKAHKKGISPIEHFIELVDEKTKGGRADLLGQLFGDRQVLEFVRPMLADFKDYIRIRGDAERASGTVADAYARRMQDANEKIKSFRIQVENLGTSMGGKLLGPIGDAAAWLANVFDTLDRRVTVFDRIYAAGDGFAKGLGFESGSLTSVMKEFREFVFGTADGGKAADQYGLIFKRFHEWGGYVREFSNAIKDNPVVKFLGEMAGHGFKLFVASAGISLLAGAVGKLAKAMWLLSGASAAVGILKMLGSIGGAAFGGLPGAPGGKTPKGGGTPNAAVGTGIAAMMRQLAARIPQIAVGALAAYGTQRFVSETSRDNAAEARRMATPRDAERDSMAAWHRYRDSGFRDDMEDRKPAQTGGGFWNAPAGEMLQNFWDGLKSWDAGMADSTGLRANAGADPIPTLESLRDAIHNPAGTQRVEVINQRERPNINMPITIYANTNASAAEIGREAGGRVQDAVAGSFSDGGGGW